MANEFKVRKGLIVQGSGSTGDETLLDVQGNQGQLFSVTDSLIGDIFTVSDISGIPILNVSSSGVVEAGTFGSYGLIVNGSNITSSGNMNLGGGKITLEGTGQILGVDTVSNGTDAANKTYVDNAVSGLAGGTVTGVSGTSPINSNGSSTTPTISIDTANASTTGALTSTDWNTFNNKTSNTGTVTGVSGTSPVASSGGTSPTISMAAASTTVSGYLTAANFTTFNNKTSNTGTVTGVSGTTPIASSGGTSPTISIATANASTTGALTGTDWTTFNNKTSNTGTVTGVSGTSPVASSGGTSPTISMAAASTTVNGYLTAANFTTFNNKTSNTGTVTGVSGTSPINSGGSATAPTISIDTADASTTGALTSTDWNTFNNKTSNAGTITSVEITTAAGLDGGTTLTGAGGTINLSLDLSEFGTAGTLVGTDEFIVLDGNAEKKKAANVIGLSIFNNDAGFTTNAGTVTGVSGTTPIASSGGTSPTISIATANASTTGALTGTDWTTFNNKTSNTGTVTGVSGTSPVASSGGTSPTISMAAASTTVNGYLTSTAFTTFNNKTSNTGTVTSVAATTTGDALDVTVTNSTTAASLAFDFAGSSTQYIDGAGDLTTFPTIGGGTVTSVSGTSPVASSGGTTPTISMAAASTTVSGYLTAANFTTFNNKTSNTGTVTGVSGTTPIASSGGTSPTISIATANASTTGALTGTDWTTFNNKTSNTGTVTGVSGTSPVASSGGTSPTISMAAATTSVSGYLTSTDWTTFNNKTSNTGTVTGVSGTAPVASSGGTSPTISMAAASTSVSGYLTSTNFTTFNNKTSNTGTITSVEITTATGLDGGATLTGAGGTIALSLDLTEVTMGTGLDSTATGITLDLSEFGTAGTLVGTDEFIVLDGNAEKKKAANVIGLSIFNNDANFTTNTGTVTGVSGTSPINSGGSATAPTISIDTANASTTGALTSTDWNTFNNKTSNTGTVTGVSGTSPVASSGGTTPTISMAAANTSTSGYLTSADWNTFDTASQKTITDFTDAGSSTITLTLDQSDGSTLTTSFSNPQGTVTGVSGTAPVASSGGTSPTISMPAATTSTSGYLTSANWNTFNGKANITGTTANGIITLNSSAPNGIASNAVTLGDDGQSTNRNAMAFNRYSSIVFDSNFTSTDNSSGIVFKRGSTTTTQGQVYYYTSSETWALSDRNNTATQATGLLAYALDNSSTGDGMMLSGFVFKEEHGFTIGAPLYLSATPGNITNTVPTSGWARVVGYAVGENTIYFSPDRTWVELG